MRKISREDAGLNLAHFSELAGLEKAPGLLAFFGDTTYEGTEPPEERAPGTMYVCVREGALQVTLKEPTQGMMTRFMVKCWKDLLPTTEAVLKGPASLWEVDNFSRTFKPKKKK